MNFQDWIYAVNQSLRATGAGYSTLQIDPADLQAAYSQGVSPVLYARQGSHPMKPILPPSGLAPMSKERANYTVRALDIAGWLLQGVGFVITAYGVFAVFKGLEMTSQTADRALATPSANLTAQLTGNIIGTMLVGTIVVGGLVVLSIGLACWAFSGMFRAAYTPN